MKWYEQAIIYQIYPKSFKDSNHDGIGDLPGIIEKLDYVKKTGANTIWLNPIFVSPQIDNGYDVSNYFAIDPVLGDMGDFRELVKQIHQRSMHLVLDLPINHTSDQHPWFQDALSNEKSIFRDYYIWQKAPAHQLPNNWGSFFGGSVWAADPKHQNDYYFHLFDAKMPDLNWKNPEVSQSMADIAKFWLDKGVDGFRLDAFIHVAKANFKQQILATGETEYPIEDTYYANLPQLMSYLKHFVQVIKDYRPETLLLGEASSADAFQAATYTNPESAGCDLVVTSDNYGEVYPMVDATIPRFFQPRQLSLPLLKQTFATWEAVLAQTSLPLLTWGNHDISRVLDRLQIPDNVRSAQALALLMFLQRGVPIIYYGEEIGMRGLKYRHLSDFEDQRALDLIQLLQKQHYTTQAILALLNAQDEMTARGPFQWSATKYGGFSDVKPWNWGVQLPTLEATNKTAPVNLHQFYQKVFQLKQTALFTQGDYVLCQSPETLYVYRRQYQNQVGLVIVNFSEQAVEYQLPQQADWQVALANQAMTVIGVQTQSIHLEAWGACALTINSKEPIK